MSAGSPRSDRRGEWKRRGEWGESERWLGDSKSREGESEGLFFIAVVEAVV